MSKDDINGYQGFLAFLARPIAIDFLGLPVNKGTVTLLLLHMGILIWRIGGSLIPAMSHHHNTSSLMSHHHNASSINTRHVDIYDTTFSFLVAMFDQFVIVPVVGFIFCACTEGMLLTVDYCRPYLSEIVGLA